MTLVSRAPSTPPHHDATIGPRRARRRRASYGRNSSDGSNRVRLAQDDADGLIADQLGTGQADVADAKSEIRITVAGPEIVGVRLTGAVCAHGLALALPEEVVLAPDRCWTRDYNLQPAHRRAR